MRELPFDANQKRKAANLKLIAEWKHSPKHEIVVALSDTEILRLIGYWGPARTVHRTRKARMDMVGGGQLQCVSGRNVRLTGMIGPALKTIEGWWSRAPSQFQLDVAGKNGSEARTKAIGKAYIAAMKKILDNGSYGSHANIHNRNTTGEP
jgi:hypothetical protein